MNYFLTISLAVLAIVADIVVANYCDKKLCHPSRPHIGCKNPVSYTSDCLGGEQMLHIEDLNEHILLMHNTYRNYAASGVHQLWPACEMMVMQWDDELEFLAKLNLQTCRTELDLCRNTLAYPNAGQNVGHRIDNGDTLAAVVIDEIILDWFGEGARATPHLISSFYQSMLYLPHREFSNFANMVMDKNDRIGCAVATVPIDDTNLDYLLTCNYAHSPLNYTTVYSSCETPGEKCVNIANEAFNKLCSENEMDELD